MLVINIHIDMLYILMGQYFSLPGPHLIKPAPVTYLR